MHALADMDKLWKAVFFSACNLITEGPDYFISQHLKNTSKNILGTFVLLSADLFSELEKNDICCKLICT